MTWKPAEVIEDFAAVSFIPITFGTEFCADPDDTIIVTELPLAYCVPGAGVCDITRPAVYLLLGCSTTVVS